MLSAAVHHGRGAAGGQPAQPAGGGAQLHAAAGVLGRARPRAVPRRHPQIQPRIQGVRVIIVLTLSGRGGKWEMKTSNFKAKHFFRELTISLDNGWKINGLPRLISTRNANEVPLIILLLASKHRSNSSTWTGTSGTGRGSSSWCGGCSSTPSTRWWCRQSTPTARARSPPSPWPRPGRRVRQHKQLSSVVSWRLELETNLRKSLLESLVSA